jgi:hypothetical protein
MKIEYVIENINDNSLLWSNAWGWTDGDDFDVFTIEEKLFLNPPIEGIWKQLSIVY